MKEIRQKRLPDKNDKEYLSCLIENVVEAYRVFLSDAMSLDYCGVAKKTRSLVTDNPDYKIKTRQIRAQKYLEELSEIDALSARFKDEVDDAGYDMRDKREAAAYEADQKAWLAGKLKVAEMRRDLLSMTSAGDEEALDAALNIFFVPLTRSEFESMKTAEVNYGREAAGDAFSADEDSSPVSAAKGFLGLIKDEETLAGGYKVGPDGIVEDY